MSLKKPDAPPKPKPITKAKAQRIIKASAKVKAHRATEAGTLVAACEAVIAAERVLISSMSGADPSLQNEVKILQAGIQRFRRRAALHLQAKAGALHVAAESLIKAERLLRKADGPGYGVVAMAQKAQADTRRMAVLRASLQIRAREMAFVLAELEQVVDPLPGLRIATAAERNRNDKIRNQKTKDRKGSSDASAVGGSRTTTSSYGAPTHASEPESSEQEGRKPERG